MIKSYSELTVQKYQQLMKLVDGAEKDDIELSPRIISVLSDIPVEDLYNMPLEAYSLLRTDASFILTAPKAVKVQKAYKVGAFNLIPTTRLQKVVTAQYIDFQELTKGDQGDDAYVNILACFLIPEGCKYADGYDIQDVREAILKEMNILDAEALYAFFFSRCERLISRTLTYSRRALRRLKRRKKTSPEKIRETMKKIVMTEASLRAGVGSLKWTPCQRLSEIAGILFG